MRESGQNGARRGAKGSTNLQPILRDARKSALLRMRQKAGELLSRPHPEEPAEGGRLEGWASKDGLRRMSPIYPATGTSSADAPRSMRRTAFEATTRWPPA